MEPAVHFALCKSEKMTFIEKCSSVIVLTNVHLISNRITGYLMDWCKSGTPKTLL